MGAVLWFSILVLLAVPQGNNAVHYSITNQAGGAFARFDKEIKIDYTFQVLKNSTDFIWMLFHQQNNADCRKNVSSVSLFLENMTDIAYSVHNKIYVGSVYLENYTGDVKREFTGILFHEMTHVWQWLGNSSTPGGLIEGIADYVRLKAGYVPSHWVKPGQGKRWDQGYDVTARFLDYCNCLKHGVVAELNNKMRIGYSDFYFVQLLGKTPEQLFQDYKALYKYNQVILAAAIQGCYAVDYTVTNRASSTPGGVRFNRDIGAQYSRQTLISATNFIWGIFQQNTPADRKNVQKVGMFVDDMDGVAYTVNDEIHVSARYIQGYSGDVKREITGVLYHEMTHVWQWNGNGQAPGGLIEGIADYVRLKAGYAPGHWVKPGEGDRWDQGYDVTARFLNYCNGLSNGFVAQLNKKMRKGYNNNYFVELLGKNVDQLWRDYKAKFNNK